MTTSSDAESTSEEDPSSGAARLDAVFQPIRDGSDMVSEASLRKKDCRGNNFRQGRKGQSSNSPSGYGCDRDQNRQRQNALGAPITSRIQFPSEKTNQSPQQHRRVR